MERLFIFLFLPVIKAQGIECVHFVKTISNGVGISYASAADSCATRQGTLPFFSSNEELEKYLQDMASKCTVLMS